MYTIAQLRKIIKRRRIIERVVSYIRIPFVQIYLRWKNLNCAGISIGNWFYMDCYKTWSEEFALFVRVYNNRYWISSGGVRKAR